MSFEQDLTEGVANGIAIRERLKQEIKNNLLLVLFLISVVGLVIIYGV